ncbi:MAG: hypothetical protein BGO27_08155 [Alphaproteobacteria bacterium 33-17]|nr:MAG: hypothetical protein BGO27_08155 [Alphaproteobacteria bacterium 33-17]
MLYSSLKYVHIVAASILVGGQLFLMMIFPKIKHLASNINLKAPRYTLLVALLGVIATGTILVDVAGMEYSDFWIKHALMALGLYIPLIGISHKFVDNRFLWWGSWFLLQVIILLMVFKPEF